jgi:serine/threonine protein kinase
MPSPTTIDDFLELVRKSEVVEEKKLTTYLEKARTAQSLPSTLMALAEVLVRDGLLTRYQAEQLLQGRWRRFCLGKYKVLEKLGAGGMGIVYLCEHKLMRRRVAVKVLPESGSEDSSSLDRFYREARAVAALDHPNIVRAYDIDQDNNLHFLVMEHVDGSSLQEIVKKTGPMDVLRACHYIRQSALGLQHAHDAAGIVHRDIKPGNILVDRNGIVKILDMGLARFFHDEEDMLSHKFEDDVLGTADYLAPEQAQDSHSVDIRADIYSLGATFYFCLTGRTPFNEGTIAQKLIWHQTRQPKPIGQLRPGVPEGVVAILERMMAKDPNQRPQTPQEVAEALTPWTQTPIPPPPEDEMPQLCPAAMGSDTSPLSGPRTTPSSGNDPSPTPRKAWQVSQSATPAPPTAPPANTKSPPSPPANSSKTNPPRGSLNLELSAPAVANRVPAAAPQARAVPVSVADSPPKQPIRGNGSASVAGPPLKTAPKPQEQGPSWKALLEQESVSEPENKVLPRAARRGPITATRRVTGLPPVDAPSKIGWIIGIASAIVVGLLLVGCILAWLVGGETNAPPLAAASPVVFHVNPRDSSNAYPSIAEILSQLRGKSKPMARIIVQEDIAESDVLVDVPHVVIEAEEGKTICWRPSPKPGATKLFAVHKAEDVCIKGFTLDGEDRVEILANLFHRCPGAKLEDMKLRGFKKYGIWVTNCEGAPDRPIGLNRLEFVTTEKDQTALFFSIEPGIRDIIAKDRYFTFRDCTFTGDGTPVKTADPAALENIHWPANVQPVKGR